LKLAIQSEPRMTPTTLHKFQLKFNTDRHFIYIKMHVDEHKQQLQSYYKLTEEEIKEITKDWSKDLLIPANPVELSDVDNLEFA